MAGLRSALLSCQGLCKVGAREDLMCSYVDRHRLISLTETVTNARFGVMPAWAGRLSDADIRAVASWVHGRGGGE